MCSESLVFVRLLLCPCVHLPYVSSCVFESCSAALFCVVCSLLCAVHVSRGVVEFSAWRPCFLLCACVYCVVHACCVMGGVGGGESNCYSQTKGSRLGSEEVWETIVNCDRFSSFGPLSAAASSGHRRCVGPVWVLEIWDDKTYSGQWGESSGWAGSGELQRSCGDLRHTPSEGTTFSRWVAAGTLTGSASRAARKERRRGADPRGAKFFS